MITATLNRFRTLFLDRDAKQTAAYERAVKEYATLPDAIAKRDEAAAKLATVREKVRLGELGMNALQVNTEHYCLLAGVVSRLQNEVANVIRENSPNVELLAERKALCLRKGELSKAITRTKANLDEDQQRLTSAECELIKAEGWSDADRKRYERDAERCRADVEASEEELLDLQRQQIELVERIDAIRAELLPAL